MTTGGSSIYWDDGTCRQRIINTDDSTANTAVFNFQQSENSGSSWKNLLEIRDNGRLVLTNKTGGIYRVDDGATNEPLIHLSNNNANDMGHLCVHNVHMSFRKVCVRIIGSLLLFLS